MVIVAVVLFVMRRRRRRSAKNVEAEMGKVVHVPDDSTNVVVDEVVDEESGKTVVGTVVEKVEGTKTAVNEVEVVNDVNEVEVVAVPESDGGAVTIAVV